jgi:hypothetical protein
MKKVFVTIINRCRKYTFLCDAYSENGKWKIPLAAYEQCLHRSNVRISDTFTMG